MAVGLLGARAIIGLLHDLFGQQAHERPTGGLAIVLGRHHVTARAASS